MQAGLLAAMAWTAGVALQLSSDAAVSAPWSVAGMGLAGVMGLVAALRLRLHRPGYAAQVGLIMAIALMAWASTGWRAQARLADLAGGAWPQDARRLVVKVVDLPARLGSTWRFEGVVLDADQRAQGVPGRLRLYANTGLMAAPAPGQVWALTVRWRPLDGMYNPGGWDPTRSLFARGVQAQGTVVAEPAPVWLHTEAGGIDAVRLAIRQAIERRVPEAGNAGVLAGLSVGDQSAIERADWLVFQRTGVAHLVSISGPHVLMVGWLAGWLGRRLWSRSARCCRWWPAPLAAAWMAVGAALAYAALAGWGIPAQRTVWMMATVTALRTWGVRWPWPLVWACAGVVVLVIDPWALWQASFWLSFVAVATMMIMAPAMDALSARASTDGLHDALQGPVAVSALPQATPSWPMRLWRWLSPPAASLWATQWRASLVLAPVALMCFQSISLVGMAVNLLAIPWVGLLIVPLSLLGVLWAPAWDVAAMAVEVMRVVLTWASAPHWAQWWMPLFPGWLGAWALLAAPWFILRVPARWRWWAAPPLVALCVLPPGWRTLPPPAHGHWAVLAADVGQGTAVVVQTARHQLLFDAGVRFPSGSDMGERVVVPALRALGVDALDLMVISHDDLDHHGGTASVLKAMPIRALSSSLPDGHALLNRPDAQGHVPHHLPCVAGRFWVWDGVRFEWLHPAAEVQGEGDNARSCVLRVQALDGMGPAALLTGDIESAQEAALIELVGASGLRSEVLIVPHHGSATSSTEAFLDLVEPQEAVIQVGRHNRYGHPHPAVLQRLTARATRVLDTPHCGAYWRHSDQPQGLCWRQHEQPYWHADRLRGSAQASLAAGARP